MMKSACLLVLVSCTIPLLTASPLVSAEDAFSTLEVEGLRSFLEHSFSNKAAGMVVGLVDKNGTKIVARGKLDNGTDKEVNGDTVFVIGSITKTFTVLLLQDMVERDEMKLADPVAKYLPALVKVPNRNGKEITLLHLAAHDSGLPFDADNLLLANAPDGNPFAGYTVEKLYTFLSGHTLRRDPGAEYEYSNVGSALLGHAIALRAGKSYEALIIERICRPLQMESTRITVTPELRTRLATGHEKSGERVAVWDLGTYAPAGALRSTANDLLKYVSANLGLGVSSLTPLMERMHAIRRTQSPGIVPGETFGNTGLAWMDFGVYQPPGMQLLGHGGGNGGFSAFVGFDKMQRRGVVVLVNQPAAVGRPYWIGWRLLQGAPLRGQDIATVEPLREYVGSGISLDLDKQTGGGPHNQGVP
jgi:CubicO group peptidase (beta-lactamase class C family)